MEFWVGCGLLMLVWWTLHRPGADLALARAAIDRAFYFACFFCLCRTALKLASILKTR